MRILSVLLIIFFVVGCTNSDNETEASESQLVITSFAPLEASVGDEIVFVGENIDPAITYRISFNGIESETTSVTETQIITTIPQGATSGEVVIAYEDFALTVGTIEIVEIIEEFDKLYGYLPIQGGGCDVLKIYNLDINTGILIDETAQLHNQSCYEYHSSNFYREANIFVHTFIIRYGQGMPYGKGCSIKNLTTGAIGQWTLSDGGDRDGSILAAIDNKIYYIYRYYDSIDDIYEIRSANINKTDVSTHYEFPTDFIYDIKQSGFLPSTNELLLFTANNTGQPILMKFNVETSSLNSTNISDTYTHIFITATERIFGVKSLGGSNHEIVELDKATGNIVNSIALVSAREVQKIDYSLSSNSIYALINEANNEQYLYKLHVDTGATSIVLLDEQNQHLDFEGIYLNN